VCVVGGESGVGVLPTHPNVGMGGLPPAAMRSWIKQQVCDCQAQQKPGCLGFRGFKVRVEG